MSWLFLRAKLCPCFRQVLPPSQGGLTSPSSGPRTAGSKHPCRVFWTGRVGLVQRTSPCSPGLAQACSAGNDTAEGKRAGLREGEIGGTVN